MEKISQGMQQNEVMKKGLRKLMLMFMLEWKTFEEESDLTTKCLQECFNELEVREKYLTSVQESVAESSKELDLIRESLEQRRKEVETKEAEFCAFQEREIRDLECKWQDFIFAKKGFDEAVKLREEKLIEQEKIGERLLEEIGFEHKQLENFCKSSFTEISMKAKEFEEFLEKLNKILSSIRKESDVLQLKERKFAERMEEFQVKENILQSMEKELETKVRSLDTAKKELREKEHYLDSIQKELREKETTLDSVKTKLTIKEDHLNSVKKELEDKDKGLDTIKKKLELCEQDLNFFEEILQLREGELSSIQEAYRQRSEDLDSREKKLDLVHGEFQLEKEKFQTEQGFFKKKLKDIALKEKQVEVKFRELEQREKHMEDRFKVLEEKMKQLKTIGNVPEKTEFIYLYNVEVERVGAISSSSADIKLVVTMDGKTLQIFLNEQANKLDSLSDDVFRSLQLSRSPAQLVLDAMEGFYPPHLMSGDTEFEGSVVKQTCILLLEQLIRVSPKIQPIVRRRARKLAREWKGKMRAMTGDQLEILGFLYLLASYGLVSSFDADELMSLLTVVAEHNKSMELCRLLGFTKKIPCFIQNLIAKQNHLEAVEYAYAFELTDHFQPIPILKDYLKQVMQISECVCNGETCSVKEKNEAIEQSVASIRAVIRCIMDHELQSEYPPAQLEECIESLTRQKADVTSSSVISEAQLKQVVSTSPSVPTDTKTLSSTSFSRKASTCMLGHSDAMASILVSMGGKNLQNFLYNHWNEQELLRIEISRALKMSCDSGLLVLEALEGFYPPEPHNEEILFDRSVIRKSCILLLEQLMRLSPEIKPKAKLEARKLAFDWKAKMIAETENYLAILGFLLLVGAYGLASSFDKYELESLCHTVAQDENAYQNFHVLGIAGENPQIEKSMDPSKTEPLCDNVELKSKARDLTSACSLSFIHCASDPAKVVLDALRKCRSANLGKCKYGPSSLMKRFCDLLEHLREVSPEITPQVKIEAVVLAVEWRETLTGSQLNYSEVLGFLQLLATFELSSSYDSDELLGLLEIVYRSRRAINLFKILGLADKIPCFIENLIRRKQWLLAIRYIHVYELVDLFPPVPLLKDFVLYSEELAKKIHDNGLGSREAQEKAINCEISALRAAVKRIVWHNLQSEYSPDHLKAHIVKLQRQMAELRIPNQHSGFITKSQVDDRDEGSLCAPISQVQKAVMKKRLASATEGVIVHESQQQQRKLKRVCQLPERTEVGPDAIICNASLSSSVQSSSQPTSPDGQISTVPPNYSEKLFSQCLEVCPEDDQIYDSGQASSQQIGDSHAYDDAEVETEEPVQINPVYHSGQNLMPKLQELLCKLKNSLSSSGKTEDHERT
ncbi:uncharacterized protein LOC107825057 [Nicotiana tabacum]|uniref:Uncharacterized protein LOC107825057 n=1 Tax=Nicotiana tabacum TaxID=4097 RepID=A0AC58TLZ5_TOBAC